METLDDIALTRLFNEGDEAAFAEIVRRYQRKIFRVCLSVTRNPADAEEVSWEVFVNAHRALKNFRTDCKLSTWLHVIARNLSRNRVSYWMRRRRTETVSIDLPLNADSRTTFAEMIPCDEPTPDEQGEREEFKSLVLESMDRLNATHHEILTLFVLRGLQYEQIAEQLGVPCGTVKSRISRARMALRSELARRAA